MRFADDKKLYLYDILNTKRDTNSSLPSYWITIVDNEIKKSVSKKTLSHPKQNVNNKGSMESNVTVDPNREASETLMDMLNSIPIH